MSGWGGGRVPGNLSGGETAKGRGVASAAGGCLAADRGRPSGSRAQRWSLCLYGLYGYLTARAAAVAHARYVRNDGAVFPSGAHAPRAGVGGAAPTP